MTQIYTIDELEKLTCPDALNGMHAREKLTLLNRVLDSLGAARATPLSQERLDLDVAHFRATDAVQSSIIAGE